jgi:tRNA dimethylallyltransferase
MIADGLVEETRRLHAQYDPALPALSSLGYREIGAYLRGEMPLAAAVERIKLETHRYVRQQETFFRKMPALQHVEVDAAPDEIVRRWYQVESI